MSSRYEETYAEWSSDPAGFWGRAAADIDWFTPATSVFNPDAGVYGRWFDDATCNSCYNCLDRHVEAGHGDRLAVIHDSPVTDSVTRFTFKEATARVSALAHVLRSLGVDRGDRVIIYMPMVPEAVFAMLACARLGAIHSVVFGGFAANELATRIDDAAPKVIISASCGIEPGRVVAYKPLLDEAIEKASAKPDACLILQREVRDTGGHMVALKWTMAHHYDLKPGEVFWAASDVGWVVGHSYICYGPLLHGCATVVYEGKPVGTPDAGAFWRVIQDHKVAALFTAPTAFRAIKKEDPQGELIAGYDLSHFRTLFLAGERSDPATILWAQEKLERPVIDHWWQTETGWAMSGNPVGLGGFPIKLGSPGKPMPGYEIHVLDDDGAPVAAGTLGNIVCKLPLPPSGFPTLWNAPERFMSSYMEEFPGYYATSDAGIIDDEGYVFIMARTDDIINVAGHRLSTSAMEEVIASHPDIAECAVVGKADQIKGQMPLGFYVTNDGTDRDFTELEAELVGLVRRQIGAVAAFKTAVPVLRLPKTRSGKVLRGTMQKIADRAQYKVPAAIEDPAILTEITEALSGRNLIG